MQSQVISWQVHVNKMRIVLIITGLVSLALGIVGIFLPLLPTTPFVLLSAYCFTKSSPRLHAWLVANKQFGPMIQQWQLHRSIPPKAKRNAVWLIILTFSVTIFFFIEEVYLKFLLVFLAVILLSFILRIPSQIIMEPVQNDELES